MATIDAAGFAAESSQLALKLSAADLPGLLRRRYEVPPGAVALVSEPDAGERLVGEGTELAGAFTAVVVKARDQGVSFEFADLATRAGRKTTAGIEVCVRLPSRDVDVRSLAQTLLANAQLLTVDVLRAYLRPAVRSGLATFVRQHTAEELMTEDPREELERMLRSELKALAFSAGLDVLEVRHPSFYCEEFEQLRRARLEAQAKEEELRRSEQLQELKARLERNEALKQQEVAEFAKVLQYQGILKELSLKHEVSRKRTEEELRRFEAIHKQVGDDDLKALVFLLEDDRLKAQLLEQLIERDMTEEQLRAKKVAELERRFEEKLQAFAGEMQALSGARSRRIAERGTRTRRVLVVHGKEARSFDPATNVRRETPKEVYDLSGRDLGYLRSVRTATVNGRSLVLLGAQGGVYVVPEGGGADEARELRFPEPPRGQGGVNATAYFDGWIYGTHSELGLVRWDFDGLATAQPLFGEVTSRHDSTRGVIVGPSGSLVFASGPNLYAHNLLRPSEPLVAFRGTGDSVTAFVVTQEELFAGTRGGRVLRWSASDPGSPRELGIRKANPIYMLRLAEVHGTLHLLVGAKEHGVTAVSIEDGRAIDYRAPDQVRWVDGATDYIFGVTRSGYALHTWEANRLEQVHFTIHLADRVQDLHVAKEPYGAAV